MRIINLYNINVNDLLINNVKISIVILTFFAGAVYLVFSRQVCYNEQQENAGGFQMKRSDFYIRIVTAVLFLAVASYIGVYIYNAAINTYVTTPAISYTVEDTLSTQGYIVRSETVITDTGAAVLPTVSEGEKVASGQAIAVEYMNSEALETVSEIRALKLSIEQLKTTDKNVAEAASLKSVMNLSAAVQSGDLSNLDELSLMIKTYVFSSGLSSESELPALEERLESLESQIEGVRTIYAQVSGTFSQVLDGYEYVDPDALYRITPTMLIGLFSTKSEVYGVGKLITEFKWFFAAIMDIADAKKLSAGRRIPVQFSGAYNEIVEMTVESIGKPEDSNCVVLFSCDLSIHEVAPLRYLRAEVVTGSVTGIRIPKEAIHLDDNAKTFIYLQTGVRAERVDVEILYELGDVYLVRSGIETGSPLRAGSTIIVKANGLKDGKIVA